MSEWPIQEPGAFGLNAEWYRANAEANQLTIQRCDDCETFRHPPRYRCGRCHSDQRRFVNVATTGTIVSWTITHKPLHPGFMGVLPYMIASVETAVGARIFCIVRNGVGPVEAGRSAAGPVEVGTAVSISLDVTPDGAGIPYAEVV